MGARRFTREASVRRVPDLIKGRRLSIASILSAIKTCNEFPMLRWTILHRHARPLHLTCLITARNITPHSAPAWLVGIRWFAAGSPSHPQAEGFDSPAAGKRLEPPGLNKIKGPDRADAWLALLEHALPPALRNPGHPEKVHGLSPTELFEILKGADKAAHASNNRDVLSYVALEKGRWGLVVWLVKHLVESLAVSPHGTDKSVEAICAWRNDTALDELTREAIDPLRADFLQHVPAGQHCTTLKESTGPITPNEMGHRALGMIWRGLGNMTIACAEGEIKPEILEIIAFLHHQGFMPSTIYDSKPSPDPTAIQQSPILNLLSSRILTSLSDAAWRAHEKLVVEEARSRGGEYTSLRPEIPGTAYRVRVAGLKPEVWLELILWSCLHGDWTAEGAHLLERLHSTHGRHQWKPLSWRSLVSKYPTFTQDWEKVEYLFNNWATSSMDVEEPAKPVSTQRTVSSELVDAYVDASLAISRPSASKHGQSVLQTVKFVRKMQQFLARSSLSLGAGSWDAIILRLFDLQDTRVYRPKTFDDIMRLSPKMGQEIEAPNTKSLPEYVFDGTAATFGLFHRALHHRIKHADVEGALRLFAALQERADEKKRQSVADFLQKRELFAEESHRESAGQFTDNFASIEYPAFYVQIPPSVLGPFLELVTDARAYQFGKWLLYSAEIDGPIIPEHLYNDPSITPALIRFAAESGDKDLLSRVIKIRAAATTGNEPQLPKKVLQSFLDSQINLMRWQAAVKILEHAKDTYGFSWNALTLCHTLRVSLLQVRSAKAGDEIAKANLARSKGLFRSMVRGNYERTGERPDWMKEQVDNLLVVLSCLGEDWANFSARTKPVIGHRVFNLPSKAFNLVLEGFVDAFGSQAGRLLIGVFWNHKVRGAQMSDSESDIQATAPPFSSFTQALPIKIRRQRTKIRYFKSSDTGIVLYGGLRPDLMTIRIVLRKATEELIHEPADGLGKEAENLPSATMSFDRDDISTDELEDQHDQAIDLSPAGMAVWGARCLKRLGMTTEDVAEELRQSLPESKLQQVLEKSPDLLEPEGDRDEGGSEEEDVGTENPDGNRSTPTQAMRCT